VAVSLRKKPYASFSHPIASVIRQYNLDSGESLEVNRHTPRDARARVPGPAAAAADVWLNED